MADSPNQEGPPFIPPLPAAVAAAVLLVLEPGEQIDHVALAVGCCLVLTDRRLLLVRDGADFRPKTGVTSWPTDGRLRLHLEGGPRDTTRLSLRRAGQSASVFLTGTRAPDVRALVAAVRHRIRETPA